MNEIMLPTPQRKELEKIFKVSRMTIWQALKGRSNSPMAQRIRKAALEKGGKEFINA
ncbi:MAG: hypothetical protein LBR65_03780 [Culturomica sp.]|jgi:DNA-binding GntR family transcriptional regulator|nr:hypothetical protein [Culturomica sp.]